MTLTALSLIAVILLWPAGGLAAGITLVAAQHIFLSYCLGEVGLSLQLVMLAFVLAAPLAGRLAAWLLESAVLPEASRDKINGAALLLALALIFGSDTLVDHFADAVALAVHGDHAALALLFVSLADSLVFCAALVAFCMLCVNLMIELPIAWLASAARIQSTAYFAPFRPLVIILGVTFSFQLILGLFEARLRPQSIKISPALIKGAHP